jgi:hypothetical protein
VNVCRSAQETGLNLAGAQFTLFGEPITLARLEVIRSIGAEATPDYGSADSGGSVGYGCLSPEEPDDIHVFSDLNGLIQADAGPFPKGALLVSSIRPTTPFVFLNVSMGDSATISHRRCGCPLEELGWPVHFHTIRSFEKLTASGMTFEDGDVITILEETLPRRFGGGPTDYQLVEELTDEGQPLVRLLVHPSVAAIDPEEVATFFLEALGTGSATRRVMSLHWRESGILSVERRKPFVTSSGKILHIWAKTNPLPEGSE